jgi:hypothetical protein
MRRLAALLLLVPLLAGCAAPDDKKADPLFGLCPQWAQGPGGFSSGLHLDNETAQSELGPANETYLGKPLDLYRVKLDRLSVDGRLELRAMAAGGKQQLAIRDYRQATPQLVPVVVFTDGSAAGREFDVFLSPVLHDAPAAPAPATLAWNATGASDVEVSATYHYKVCGL